MDEGKSIPGLAGFLESPAGRYLLAWEQRHFDRAVADIFGYHALQVGTPALDSLRENRMPLRALVVEGGGDGEPADPAPPPRCGSLLVAHFDELPFASQSLDLVVMPHVLEYARDPHAVLREVERVLVPEGQVVLTGFNPASLWGVRHGATRLGMRPFLPEGGQLIALPRIKDWLKLLSFDTHRGRFGCYAPWARSASWLARWSFLEKAGDRWWPVLGSVYALSAIKRVRGMRLVGLARRRREERLAALAPLPHHREATDLARSVRVPVPGPAANEPPGRAVRG